MVAKPRALVGLLAAVTLALLASMPRSADAMTSVEGALIGDQGYYWLTPAEVWIFPHRIGNIDNRVMLQWRDAPTGLPLYNMDGPMAFGAGGPTGFTSSVQRSRGGGFVLELVDNLNLGMWLSAYNPGTGAFVARGVAATDWVPNTAEDLVGVDIYGANAGLEAGRKVDLFASFWLPDLSIETGLRLWWGSSGASLLNDDSTGPIDIDTDSNPGTTTPATALAGSEDHLSVAKSKYGLNDFGLGLGAGWAGIEGLRADLGFNLSLFGVGWEPNGLGNFVDIGGSAIGINLRSHYDLSPAWTVGGFFRFHTNSMGLEPKKHRDGSDMVPLYVPPTPDGQQNLPTPTGAPPTEVDPAALGAEPFPSQGIKYEEGGNQLQVAALVGYKPNSRAKLYGAFGFRRDAASTKLSISRPEWYAESKVSWLTLPFIHVGVEGKIFNWLDLFLGATKQFRGQSTTTEYYDSRIPSDATYQGPPNPNPTATPGAEGNTNANRRTVTTKSTLDNDFTSTTALMLGARVHYKAFDITAQMNPDWLLTGTYALSGTPAAMFGWVAVTYDWDYDSDVTSGNGTSKYVAKPHEAEKPAYDRVREDADEAHKDAEPAPAPAPAPAPEYEEFDS
jgi:hypothetical protein